MTRYFNISKTLSLTQLELFRRYKSVLDLADYAQLLSEGANATIYYMLGTEETGNSIDLLYPGRFNSKARVITTNTEENDIINCDILNDEDDLVDKGDSVILITGWGIDQQADAVLLDKSPVIGIDFAEWLVRKNVGMFITDLPCLANVSYMPEFEELHKILSIGEISIITGINNINVLHSGLVNVTALPIKIGGANWSFVNVIISKE